MSLKEGIKSVVKNPLEAICKLAKSTVRVTFLVAMFDTFLLNGINTTNLLNYLNKKSTNNSVRNLSITIAYDDDLKRLHGENIKEHYKSLVNLINEDCEKNNINLRFKINDYQNYISYDVDKFTKPLIIFLREGIFSAHKISKFLYPHYTISDIKREDLDIILRIYLNGLLNLEVRSMQLSNTSDLKIIFSEKEFDKNILGCSIINYHEALILDNSSLLKLEKIVLHEIFHTFGIGHEDNSNSLMYYSIENEHHQIITQETVKLVNENKNKIFYNPRKFFSDVEKNLFR